MSGKRSQYSQRWIPREKKRSSSGNTSEQLGENALVVDVGVVGKPATQADVSREEVADGGRDAVGDLAAETRREGAPGDG
jgi:hypothetical protein